MNRIVSGARLPALGVAAAGTWLFSAASLAAWDVSFQPRAEVGVANYSLDFGATSQLFSGAASLSTSKLSFDTVMPSVGAGLTLFARGFFLDLAAQSMFDGSASDSNATVIANPYSLAIATPQYDGDDIGRSEYALAFGYGVTDAFSLYAGYKWAYTDFGNVIGVGPFEQQSANGAVVTGTFHTSASYEFNYAGPFVGATAGWGIGNGPINGRLALSAAVAFLDGDLTTNSGWSSITLSDGTLVPGGSPAVIFDSSGKSVGILIGVSWVGQTGVDGLFYSVGINGYTYDFSADDEGGADISESVLQLKAGLAYAF